MLKMKILYNFPADVKIKIFEIYRNKSLHILVSINTNYKH